MSLSRSVVTALAALAAGLLLSAPCLGGDLPPERPHSRIPDQASAEPAPRVASAVDTAAEAAALRPPLRLTHAAYPGALRDRPGAPAERAPELRALLVPARVDAPPLQVDPRPADPPRWSNPGAVSL